MIEIKDKLSEYGISCSEKQASLLYSYMTEILKYNENINLTAITDPEDFIIKHYVDSLSVIGLEEVKKANEVIDVGTGGGFPGIPLAITFPDKKFTLLDSLDKRLKIIKEISNGIGINNIETVHARAEDAGQLEEHREKYDLCVSRAVANLTVLSEYCLPFVKPGGYFIPYKSNDIEAEVNEAKQAINLLGGKLVSIEKSVTNQSLLIISKTKETPRKYPRKPGDPKRKPL